MGFAVGPVAAAAFGLVTVPVVAWIFPPADVGRLNIVQIAVSLCVLLFGLGLDQAYVREFHESGDRPALLKACFAPGCGVTLLIVLITAPFGSYFSKWLFGLENPIYYWVVVACVVSSFVSRFLSLILRMEERGLAFSMSQMLPKALLLLVVGTMAFTTSHRSFIHLQLAFLVSLLSVTFIYGWNTRHQWSPAVGATVNLAHLRNLLHFGGPLIFAGLAYWGLATTSSLTLRSMSSFSELAVYSVSMSFAGVGSIFSAIFSVVWAPMVYKWVALDVDMKRVDSIARQALALVCAILVLSGIFSWLTDFVLPSRYEQVKYLVLCCVAQPLLYTLSEVTCVGIAITRRTMLSLWSTLAATLTNIILSILLVPTHGAAGAVIANSIAFVVFFVARTEASARVWRPFPRARLYVFVCAGVGLSITTVVFGQGSIIKYYFWWLAMLPVIILSFRKEWVEIYKAVYKALPSIRKQPRGYSS